MEKQVTVLMSTYNGEQYLQEQVDSILRQKGVQVRLLVRDDGSTDQTQALLNAYQEKGQLHYYSGSNLGTARSFLQLVKDSPESEYYAFSDQDDVWKEDKLSRALSLIQQSRTAEKPLLYAGSFQMTDAGLKEIHGGENHYTTQTFANAIVYSCCTGCTMVMNKRLRDILASKPLPQHLMMHDDWIHKVCLAMGGKVVFDSQPMMLYRQHGNNVDGGIHTLKDKVHKVWAEKSTRARIMSNQLGELLKLYGDQLPEVNQKLLKHALHFGKGNLSQRVRLAFDPTYTIREKRNLNHEFRISLLMNYW
ncbi:glycosyltransferase family 2 protein [Limosilactobacillus sp.]|uniref:glycosyltransferase family 2 protein n=1 Tax=Limosilactobacillus sp. TaxID=2773925 RepID=UPI003F045947